MLQPVTDTYFVIGSPDPDYTLRFVREVEEENKEDAVRSALSDEEIVHWTFQVVKAEEVTTSEEFNHDGAFDGLAELVEEGVE